MVVIRLTGLAGYEQVHHSAMTLFDLLRRACGLSQQEAADLLGVALATVKAWGRAKNKAPPGVIAELRALYARIDEAANQMLDVIEEQDPTDIELGFPADEHEAQAMGWPCVGAWRAMAGIVVAAIDKPVRLVPRGSTPSTAAAADARERAR